MNDTLPSGNYISPYITKYTSLKALLDEKGLHGYFSLVRGIKLSFDGDCSKESGIFMLIPRVVQQRQDILANHTFLITQHIESNSISHGFFSANTINSFLHLPVAAISYFYRIGGSFKKTIIEKHKCLFDIMRINLLKSFTETLKLFEFKAKFCQLCQCGISSAPPVKQGIYIIHEFPKNFKLRPTMDQTLKCFLFA